jgi:hypothetical protein
LDLALSFGLFAARLRVARTGFRMAAARVLDFFPNYMVDKAAKTAENQSQVGYLGL